MTTDPRRRITLSLARPDLAREWHPTRNGSLRPGDVTRGTNAVVWWLGPCGHEWDMSVKQRTGPHGSGCSYCAGKRLLPEESFAARFPGLADEWHPTKNGDLRANAVTVSSNRKAWWRCQECGHEWRATIAHRTGEGTGCPVCAGLVVVRGRSFADRFPEIAAEWHPEKNGDLRPDAVAPWTHKRAWWRCANCGIEWQAAVSSRARGRGCSRCRPSGWSEVTLRIAAELGALLSLGDLHEGPRTVRAETGWEPDIVLPNERIAIDIDGRFWHGDGHHKTRQSGDRDTRKFAAYSAAGWTLIRVREAPLEPIGPYDFVVTDLRETRDVVVRIVEQLERSLGVHCPDIESYRSEPTLLGSDIADALISRYRQGAIAGKSLAEVFPELAAEWHPTKNGVLTPRSVMAGSGRYAWWRCANGHDWRSRILNRSHGTGCPICSGNQAGQGNTLFDRHPALAAQWHPTKNAPLMPDQVTPGTTRKVWWRCEQGHEWEASIASRVRGNGCRLCRNRKARH